MDQLKQTYPEAAGLLEPLPHHMVERVGNTALRLRHADMHPIKEVEGENGITRIPDFDQVITNPEYQIEELSEEALKAAYAGKQKLADVINNSARALRTAYDDLELEGRTFGPGHLETEDEEFLREFDEQEEIFSLACERQISAAAEAKASGDVATSVKQLESLVLLHSIRNTMSRKVLRDVVRKGLAEELVSAAHGTEKLLTGENPYSDRVNASMLDARNLLETATGQRLDLRFRPAGKVQLTFLSDKPEDYKDYMAAITAPNSAVGIEEGFKNASMSRAFSKAAKLYDGEAPVGAIGSAEYLDATFEIHNDWNNLSDALDCSDPKRVLELANYFDVTSIQLLRVIGDHDRSSDTFSINEDSAGNLLSIAQDYPDFAPLVASSNYIAGRNMHVNQALAQIKRGFALLKEAGIDDKDLATKIIASPKPIASARNIRDIALGLKQRGYHRSFAEAYKNSLSATPIMSAERGEIDPETAAQDIIVKLDIYDAYMDMYRPEHYGKDVVPPVMQSEKLGSLVDYVSDLGIPKSVSNAMVQSWCTYNHLRVINDNPPELPGVKLKPRLMMQAILEGSSTGQVDAINTRLNKLNALIEEHGLKTTTDIIQIFGIYNFGRHKPADLADQLKRWQTGDQVKTVVVDPRSDWNSYTGRHHEFDQEVGDGIFYFEANSARQVAKTAVKVGQHERKHNRAPDVRRFVIHGHGSPRGVVLGVNGEGIDLYDYAYAAIKNQRLPKAERNDYRRHLGPNFSIVLMSCSAAGQNGGAKNIAQQITDWHSADVKAADQTVHGMVINADGSVVFKRPPGKGLLEATTFKAANLSA